MGNIRTAADVRRVCAEVLSMAEYEPQLNKTYCNLALNNILSLLGLPDFCWDMSKQQRPMLANDIAEKLETTCKELTFIEAFEYANDGAIVIAAMKLLHHGHVAMVYPFPGLYTSGKWARADMPCVANVGRTNGIMPLNYAFGAKPRLWLVDL